MAKHATVVFTSMNAVEVVALHLKKEKPDWNVYCIGIATNKLVRKHFGENIVISTAINALELAKLIVAENLTNQLSFFCGEQRREELPIILRNNGIRVKELIVYQTTEVSYKVEKVYQGILFFSPSAVISFFKTNNLSGNTVLFAIGNTTAGELKKYSTNSIVVSDLPGKDYLVKKMIEYYNE